MSYDVFLQRFHQGRPVAVDSPDAWVLLEGAWTRPPDELGYCRVRRDADEGDLFGAQSGRPVESLMFNRAGRAIYHLMFDLAVAGDMVVMPPDSGPFLVREEQRAHLPPDLARRAVVVGSGAELIDAVEDR